MKKKEKKEQPAKCYSCKNKVPPGQFICDECADDPEARRSSVKLTIYDKI